MLSKEKYEIDMFECRYIGDEKNPIRKNYPDNQAYIGGAKDMSKKDAA